MDSVAQTMLASMESTPLVVPLVLLLVVSVLVSVLVPVVVLVAPALVPSVVPKVPLVKQMAVLEASKAVLLAFLTVVSKDVNSILVASVASVKVASLMAVVLSMALSLPPLAIFSAVLATLVLALVASLALASAVADLALALSAVLVAAAVSLVLLEALVALVLQVLLVVSVEPMAVLESELDLMSTSAVYKAWADLEASVALEDLMVSQATRPTFRDLAASEA